ncbi:M1 family aminopeptidase [Paludibaculum fermentans]|uniref:M1 family metallopeptidase n=1 Tax=Paludibaculum fermentans TaxID=1473598 RepID=UPI003EB75C6C
MKTLRLIACLLMAAGVWAAQPLRYALELTVRPERPEFSGVVRIAVRLDAATQQLTLNAKDLTVTEAEVRLSGRRVAAHASVLNPEEMRLEWPEPLGPGEAEVEIRYQGRIDEKAMEGPYRRQVDGQWYVFTTFTAIEARRAIPCFDEPRFKTPWQVTLHVRREHRAFSNAPLESEVEEAEGMKAVRFVETAPLPSEIVAFAVGPFDTVNGPDAGQQKVPVRVVTPQGRAEQGRYAADVTDRVMTGLERYTGIPYPFRKLDHLARAEGAFGAVENPGLINYQQSTLLAEPGKDSEQWRERLRQIMTHELAHQWFGNLVTQAGWEDVWLSEGFATWLAGVTMDAEHPAPEKNLAAVAARERIMGADAGPKARPVRVPMRSRAELNDVYSRVVYQKGAAVLLMLEGWHGAERFQRELQTYLKRRPYGTATTDDLAQVLDAGQTLHSFLDQPGVPAIQVKRKCAGGRGGLVVEQAAGEAKWAVPVCWKSNSGKACTLLTGATREVELEACPAWVFANAGGTGYYRTVWTDEELAALAEGGLAELSAAERLTLVYDLKAGGQGRALLALLARDAQPRVAQAATEALKAVKEPKQEKP